MNVEDRGPLPKSNFTDGRDGNPIALIVDHWMTSNWQAAESRFKNPVSQVSAHYGVTQGGRILQWVRDEDTAYHAGQYQINELSIGIEHECGPTLPPSDALYRASAELHRHLSKQHGLLLEVGSTVKRHREIVATACPGTLDVERIVNMATEYVTKAEWEAYKAALQKELDEQYQRKDALPQPHSHPVTGTAG